MTSKTTAKELYAEMDRATPGWRQAKHASFEVAVLAAGPVAVEMCAAWKAAFRKKTDSRLMAKNARNEAVDRIAQERYQQHPENHPLGPKGDIPAFEQSSSGRHIAAEWVEHFMLEHQPGWPGGRWKGAQAQITEDCDDSQTPATTIGRQHDSLYHPDRPANAAPWSFPSYVWAPVAPRSYAGSPKCY